MHTTEGTQFRFHHNGDFSGEIRVVNKSTEDMVVKIPFEDFKTLVAAWVRSVRISNVEDSCDDGILLPRH